MVKKPWQCSCLVRLPRDEAGWKSLLWQNQRERLLSEACGPSHPLNRRGISECHCSSKINGRGAPLSSLCLEEEPGLVLLRRPLDFLHGLAFAL